MEDSSNPSDMIQQTSLKKRGGFRTLPFIIANESLERVASYGLLPNMILYLMGVYHMSVVTGTNVLSFWSAATNFIPIAGAFISDSYLGRYRTIVAGSCSTLMGMLLLWLTTVIRHANPPKCIAFSPDCKPATPFQLTLLYASFTLMSIGAGGVRPCSLAFGADQLNQDYTPLKYKRVLQSFFNWYYASASVSIIIATTVIVYIQDHLGWKVGFGIPAILMFLSTFLFVCASSIYVKAPPKKSLLVGFAQATVAFIRNRSIPLPPRIRDGHYHHNEGSKMVMPSDKLRFLNKACIITDPPNDFSSERFTPSPWRLCTVEQVEELKALLKVLPIWSTGITIALNIGQQTLPILQASSMDRHVTRNFKIPAASLGLFTITTLAIWVGLYDRLIVPHLAKITGKPYGLGLKYRMGIGLVLTTMAMALSAIVEGIRRKRAIKEGFADNPQGVSDMSAFWLAPQYCLNGLAEAFFAIGQTEFYYSQFPDSMKSIASAMFGLGLAIGSLLVGVTVSIVDDVTGKGGKVSWVSNNLNQGHYDYYYWILTVLSGINVLYFLVCCWAYGPCDGERTKSPDEDENESKKQEEPRESEETEVPNSG